MASKATAKAPAKTTGYTRRRATLSYEVVKRGEDLIAERCVPGRGIEFADARTKLA